MPDSLTHSPLPWTVKTDGAIQRVMSGDYYVARCHEAPGDVDDEGNDQYSPEANAAFIVRAVNAHAELVAALKAHDDYMLGAGYSGHGDTALHPKAADNWRNVRAAIAKAEGRDQ